MLMAFVFSAAAVSQEEGEFATVDGGEVVGTPVGVGYSRDLGCRVYYFRVWGDSDVTERAVSDFKPEEQERLNELVKKVDYEGSRRNNLQKVMDLARERRELAAYRLARDKAIQDAENEVYLYWEHPYRTADGSGTVSGEAVDVWNRRCIGNFRDIILNVPDELQWTIETAFSLAEQFRSKAIKNKASAKSVLWRVRRSPLEVRQVFSAMMKGGFGTQLVAEKRGAGWDVTFELYSLEVLYVELLADL